MLLLCFGPDFGVRREIAGTALSRLDCLPQNESSIFELYRRIVVPDAQDEGVAGHLFAIALERQKMGVVELSMVS